MKIAIRVKPGSSRTAVGGRYQDALVVAVQPRPVDGKATEAALEAISKAAGCRLRDVRLVSGATSRIKIIDLPDEAAARLAELY